MNDTIDIEATIAQADTDFPALFQLFGGYFHEDWRDEHDAPDAAVQAFVSEAPPEAAAAAIGEIDRLLDDQLDDAALSRIVEHGFDSNYLPSADGITTTEWLRQIRGMLRGATTKNT